MEYGVEMLLYNMLYVTSFMKIDPGVLAILRICLRNIILVLLTGGIYELRRSDEVRCSYISTKFHDHWFRNLKVTGGDTHTDARRHTH
jgi:hypothetical protein